MSGQNPEIPEALPDNPTLPDQGPPEERKCQYCRREIDPVAKVCPQCRLAQHQWSWTRWLFSRPLFLDHRVAFLGLLISAGTFWYAGVRAREAEGAKAAAEEARQKAAESGREARRIKDELIELLNSERKKIEVLRTETDIVSRRLQRRNEIEQLFVAVVERRSRAAFDQLKAVGLDPVATPEVRSQAIEKIAEIRSRYPAHTFRNPAFPHKNGGWTSPCDAVKFLQNSDPEIRIGAAHDLRDFVEGYDALIKILRTEKDLMVVDFAGFHLPLLYGRRGAPPSTIEVNPDEYKGLRGTIGHSKSACSQ